MAFSDSIIAAAVRSGQYSDSTAESYLTQTLIKRRDATERTYLAKSNPIVNPVLDTSGTLVFQNAAVDYNVVPAVSVSYRTAWYQFDNGTGESVLIGESSPQSNPRVQAPGALEATPDSFVRVGISSLNSAQPTWSTPVHVYFRRTTSRWQLADLERFDK